MTPLKILFGSVAVVSTLEEEASNTDELVLWLDRDPQGENITFDAIKVCKDSNPLITGKDIKRIMISGSDLTPGSDLTRKEIMNAWQHMVVPEESVSFAVDVRKELDFELELRFLGLRHYCYQKHSLV